MSLSNIIDNKNSNSGADAFMLGVLIGSCLPIGTVIFLVLIYVLVLEKKIIKTQDNSVSLNQFILKLYEYLNKKGEKIN
jgi:hypothetical protein